MPKMNFSTLFFKVTAFQQFNKSIFSHFFLVLCSFSYLSPFNFKFSSTIFPLHFPFSLASLFPFLLFFPHPSHFSSSITFPSFQNFPPNFPRVSDSPTSPTPSYASANDIADSWKTSWKWQKIVHLPINYNPEVIAKMDGRILRAN